MTFEERFRAVTESRDESVVLRERLVLWLSGIALPGSRSWLRAEAGKSSRVTRYFTEEL